ncbi:hypothetical protein [Kribbella shirazensis]|uniref:Uncharacterized protein n=1 Tax=Kribbella shirazensis TaxID=1105143 RepID=A0A7X6A1R7_9ACTN|nr:hypothetical protein [Kribbella shirazensis]NIK58532.1 hypothetical protein [Kribbella shirazensis]
MARGVFGVVAGLLYVGIAVLLFKGPSFTIEDDGEGAVHVSCGSLIAVGWPSDHSFLDTEGSSSWGDHVTSDRSVGTEGRLGIARDCSERRDTYLSFAVIAAAAANLATLVAVMAGRAARREDPVTS